jgi:hypothetical protein
MGPLGEGFLGSDISMRAGDRIQGLAPAPSLGVSFGHGVRSRSPAAGTSPIAGVGESSAGAVRQRTRRDDCATDCESDARRDVSESRSVSRRCYRVATATRSRMRFSRTRSFSKGRTIGHPIYEKCLSYSYGEN